MTLENPTGPEATVVRFLEAFCDGDLTALGDLLTEDLRFEGPFLRVQSRSEYLDSLRGDPPEPAELRIRRMVSEGDTVGVLWEYRVREDPLLISQWSRLRDGRIAEIELVFDTSGVAPDDGAADRA